MIFLLKIYLQKNELNTVKVNFCDVIECSIGVYQKQSSQGVLAKVFSCEFCEISKNTFFYRASPLAALVYHFILLKISIKIALYFTCKSPIRRYLLQRQPTKWSNTVKPFWSFCGVGAFISTSNHMFVSAIWDKYPECIFETFEIAPIKRGQLQNFQNHAGDLSKNARTKHVITS